MSTHGTRIAAVASAVLLGLGLVTAMVGCVGSSGWYSAGGSHGQSPDWGVDSYGSQPMDANGQSTYGQSAYTQTSMPSVVRQQSPPSSGSHSAHSHGTVLPPAAANDAEADDDSGFQLSDLDPTKVYAAAKAAAGYGPDEPLARELYAQGQQLYADQQYEAAAKKFKTAAGRWPDSTLQENSLFMLGQSYFFADLYPEAVEVFEDLVDQYDYTKHLDAVAGRMFEIARYWDRLDERKSTSLPLGLNVTDSSRPTMQTFGAAIRTYRFIQMHDPTGPLADDAVMAAGNAYFRKDLFEEAAGQYDVLRQQYSDSEHLITAQLLAVQCREAMYQGPLYDATLLKEAAEIADQTLLQFPGQLGQERDRLTETSARINRERANRDWTIARYYEKKKCYRAAAFYYQEIIDEYPGTQMAGASRERIEATRHLPPEPPDRFQWLTRFFGPTD